MIINVNYQPTTLEVGTIAFIGNKVEITEWIDQDGNSHPHYEDVAPDDFDKWEAQNE